MFAGRKMLYHCSKYWYHCFKFLCDCFKRPYRCSKCWCHYHCSRFSGNCHFYCFRKVWPLELLAFIASCHALSLNCQRWVDKTQTTHRNTVNKDTPCKHAKATGGKARISASAKIIQEDLKQPEIMASHTGEIRKEHCSNLTHPFQRHIKPKKRYEIEVLSKVGSIRR